MERTVNANLGTVGVGFGGCFRQNISVREKVNTQKTQYLRGSANNAYIHREKRFSLTLWGKIHNNGLVSHYKMIIPRPKPPFSSSSSSFSLFFSFSLLFFLSSWAQMGLLSQVLVGLWVYWVCQYIFAITIAPQSSFFQMR